MSDWILVPCLVKLRDEFNLIAPNRDRTSDGSIGDTAHEKEVSDHNPDETGSVPIHDADHINEVHAIDVDTDFRVPGLTMETVVQFLLGRCRSGAEKRLRYIIYNRRIWEASNDWRQRAYTGSSPHTEHAHLSASYVTSLEASTAPWHLEELVATIDKEGANLIIDTLLARRIPFPYDPANPTRTIGDLLGYGGASISNIAGAVDAKIKPRFDALAAGQAQDDVDENAIAANVLAGLTPERLGAAMTAAGFTPEAIADAIPETLADRVLDRLAERVKASSPTS